MFCIEITLPLSNTFSFDNWKYEVKRLHLQLFAKKNLQSIEAKSSGLLKFEESVKLFWKKVKRRRVYLGDQPGICFAFVFPPSRQFSEMGIIFFGKQYIFLKKKIRSKQNFDTCPSLSNMNYVVSKIVDPTSSSFLLVSAKDALSSNWFNTCVETLVFTHRPHYHSNQQHHPDMEFVTSGTSDTNVKFFGLG